MKKVSALDRLLRLRTLLEDVGRVELEARMQELVRVEREMETSRQWNRELRWQGFAAIGEARDAGRLEAEVLARWVADASVALAVLQEQRAMAADAAKAAYLERRKDRRQVESVLEARATVQAIEQGRREQRTLDDWFGQKLRFERKG